MAVLATLSVVVLVAVFAVVVAFTATTTRANNVEKSNSVLVPFAAAVTSLGGPLRDNAGNNLIECPAGTKINVVAAYYDVYDPYTQCSLEPNSVVQDQCRDDNSSDDICRNTESIGGEIFGVNAACGPAGGDFDCRMRDATAFLGTRCNDKKTCDVVVDNAFFGPDPCNLLGAPGSDDNFDLLPAIPSEQNEPPRQGYYVHGVFACVPE